MCIVGCVPPASWRCGPENGSGPLRRGVAAVFVCVAGGCLRRVATGASSTAKVMLSLFLKSWFWVLPGPFVLTSHVRFGGI